MSLEAEQILVEAGMHHDLDNPVLLASGELGIYYDNTEKALQDSGAWEQYGDNATAMIDYAMVRTKEVKGYGRLVQLLAEEAQECQRVGHSFAISGGQRRDWLFSGPVAQALRVPHLALYKLDGPQEGRVELLQNGELREVELGELGELGRYHVLHIVDLVTEGSSIYRNEGRETGWVPMVRRTGAMITDVLAVVDRQQGGKEMLKSHGITLQALVTIDADFLRQHSRYPERAVAYFHDPAAWSQAYLQEHGVLAFIDAFDPKGSKMPRAKRFLDRYRSVLQDGGRWNELVSVVEEKFGYSINLLYHAIQSKI